MIEAAIGLGSNLGDRKAQLQTALRRLDANPHIRVGQVSAMYETAPWGETDQPAFLNACVLLQTSLSPEDLLAACLGIEAAMGRLREKRWGPRLIDLDVLFYGDVEMESDTLTLPHPEIQNRAFVLAPLAELAPDVLLHGRTVLEHLQAIDTTGIAQLEQTLDLTS
ncbi:MAG: 2-amino-4-hydroxy-6-hydroxymethyldihydropteridine diphosphokinase [Henriciella sp.]|nr:2-amino-4-hydroxy-6-hydroxymethyldihydropteridine diphosphokinase [Henriciella sp.]